jgi:hypothetical protein
MGIGLEMESVLVESLTGDGGDWVLFFGTEEGEGEGDGGEVDEVIGSLRKNSSEDKGPPPTTGTGEMDDLGRRRGSESAKRRESILFLNFLIDLSHFCNSDMAVMRSL